MAKIEKLCTLCMDEMSLKTHLFYSIPGDKIIGLEDFEGGCRTNKVATSALVFMVRGRSGNWKQPLGYVLVNGGCPSRIVDDLVKEALDKLDAIGLQVMGVISDMGSNFQSLAIRLKVTPDRPWFIHNSKKYFLLFDAPHLLKCVRNNLMKHFFRFGLHIATWKDIENFYQDDKALHARYAPNLTEKHIKSTNFDKMKVKYATQILRHTVTASICIYVSMGGLPISCHEYC